VRALIASEGVLGPTEGLLGLALDFVGAACGSRQFWLKMNVAAEEQIRRIISLLGLANVMGGFALMTTVRHTTSESLGGGLLGSTY
jgi:hypothetical protein